MLTQCLIDILSIEWLNICSSMLFYWATSLSNLFISVSSKLCRYFSPDKDSHFSLALRGGKGGAMLTHTHAQQFKYYSFTLLFDSDLPLSDLYIKRCNYGAKSKIVCLNYGFVLTLICWIQNINYLTLDKVFLFSLYVFLFTYFLIVSGVHRLQKCHFVSKTMHSILNDVQEKVGSWVGLSVVHLGYFLLKLFHLDIYYIILLPFILLSNSLTPQWSRCAECARIYWQILSNSSFTRTNH